MSSRNYKTCIFALALFGFGLTVSYAQTKPNPPAKVEAKETAPEQKTNAKAYEVGCGMCIFKMEAEKKCALAIKIDGKPYLVGGTAMLDHGDAHSKEGMCNTARMAIVEGKVEGDKFMATKFELLPNK
jgi:hypothetical protein